MPRQTPARRGAQRHASGAESEVVGTSRTSDGAAWAFLTRRHAQALGPVTRLEGGRRHQTFRFGPSAPGISCRKTVRSVFPACSSNSVPMVEAPGSRKCSPLYGFVSACSPSPPLLCALASAPCGRARRSDWDGESETSVSLAPQLIAPAHYSPAPQRLAIVSLLETRPRESPGHETPLCVSR